MNGRAAAAIATLNACTAALKPGLQPCELARIVALQSEALRIITTKAERVDRSAELHALAEADKGSPRGKASRMRGRMSEPRLSVRQIQRWLLENATQNINVAFKNWR